LSRSKRPHRLVSPADSCLARLVNKLESERDELRRMLRAAEDLRAAFEAVVAREAAALPPAPAKLPPTEARGREGWTLAVLDISDVHAGERVDAGETGGLNSYDLAEMKRRASALLSRALESMSLHGPDRLHVHLLGDIVTGERIYPGQSWSLDANLIRQVFEAERVLTSVISELAQAVPEVRVFCVAGNHGRAGRPGEYHPRTNFDVLAYVLLSRRLSSLANVSVHVSEAPWQAYEVPELGGQRHLLLHGDGIRSSLSLPYYGLDRAVREWTRTAGMSLDYVHVGHFHRAADVQLPRGELLVNGSWVGATPHTLRHFREAVVPEQRLHIFDERGLVATYRLVLADVPRLAPGGFGLLGASR